MAGDWIKMRVGLTTNPRVMRIAECLIEDDKFLEWSGLSYGVGGYPPLSEAGLRAERHAALRVTRYVTVTALLRFWGYANEHAKGELIAGIFPEDVDEITGVPGFADAITAAGWAEFDAAGGMTLPNFHEHNTSADARSSGAERQKRYRERHRQGDSDSNVTRDVTVTPREEKSREEKKDKRPVGAALLTDVDPQVAADFLALRKAKRSVLTETALAGIRREAEKAGLTLESALRICCERGWLGFSASWQGIPATQAKPAVTQPGGGRRAL